MLYAYLFLATSAMLVSAAPSPLKQATRREIINRSHLPFDRRQSLPSGGVYPLCTGSLPRGTANTINTAITVAVAVEGPGVIRDTFDTSATGCANQCLANSACANYNPEQGFCQQLGQFGRYVEDDSAIGIYPGQTCQGAQVLYGAALSCCDYVTAVQR